MRKNILVTGASSGLGRQMAREFAAKGSNLALCARRTDRLEELKAELVEARHPEITVLVRQLDVTDHAAVFDVVKAFRGDLGRLDRVVVNAGLGKGQPLGTGRFDANLQTAQTNFTGALAQVEAAMEVFREQNDGHLVVISSMSALRGMPRNLTTYAATKAGVALLAEGLRAGAAAHEGQPDRRQHDLPRVHPVGDERAAQEAADVHGRHRDRRPRDRRRHREGEADRARAGLAVGAARRVPQGRAAARRLPVLRRGVTEGSPAGAVRREDAFDAAAVDAWLRGQPGFEGLTGTPEVHAVLGRRVEPDLPAPVPRGPTSCCGGPPAGHEGELRARHGPASTRCSGSSSRRSATCRRCARCAGTTT